MIGTSALCQIVPALITCILTRTFPLITLESLIVPARLEKERNDRDTPVEVIYIQEQESDTVSFDGRGIMTFDDCC